MAGSLLLKKFLPESTVFVKNVTTSSLDYYLSLPLTPSDNQSLLSSTHPRTPFNSQISRVNRLDISLSLIVILGMVGVMLQVDVNMKKLLEVIKTGTRRLS